MRPSSCPLVLIQTSNSAAPLYRSAKSCAECRERRNAMMKRRAERMTKRSPTVTFPSMVCCDITCKKTTHHGEIEDRRDAKSKVHSPGHPRQFCCMLHERCAVVPVSLAAHSHEGVVSMSLVMREMRIRVCTSVHFCPLFPPLTGTFDGENADSPFD